MVFQQSRHSVVINDFEEAGWLQMGKLNLLEFIEFLSRAAFVMFRGSEMEGLRLEEKVGHLMDRVFYAVLG